MRTTIMIQGFGSTMSQIVDSLNETWREFMEDDSVELPRDSEVHISKASESATFDAICTIRTKIEQ